MGAMGWVPELALVGLACFGGPHCNESLIDCVAVRGILDLGACQTTTILRWVPSATHLLNDEPIRSDERIQLVTEEGITLEFDNCGQGQCVWGSVAQQQQNTCVLTCIREVSKQANRHCMQVSS